MISSKVTPSILGLALIAGCACPHRAVQTSVPGSVEALEQALAEVDENIRGCMNARDYRGAIRLLPQEAAVWDKLIEKTGKDYEGAQGFLHGLVMGHTAVQGDSQWGEILDDPEIPYR